ncbi:DNA/RNA non-specific endonuclease [Kribbella sp. NPDC005582]|uniref:DNA/RNA non-specific endonuclease n=1 Tax=Kribbella sp. NPDC005582 TaxID=3156893 RepID=UPI0033A0D70C
MSNGTQDEAVRRAQAEERLQNPALRAVIAEAIAAGEVPPVLVSEQDAERLDKGDDLESVLRTDELEAIVRRFGRPPLLVEDNAVVMQPLPEFAAGTDVLIKGVESYVKSVGRVEFVNHDMEWGGTGWVIDEPTSTSRIVATNRHVAKLVAARVADGSGVFLRSPAGILYKARIDFKEEVHSNPGDATPILVTKIIYLADDASPDLALLRIEGEPGLPSALPLADEEAEQDQRVALIGYPAYDSRNDKDDQARYFQGVFNVKRFAPGFVMQALGGGQALSHDCTSLGGNSGSPLISLENKGVVGLHFSGQYGVQNNAVGVGTLRRLLAGERPMSRARGPVVVEAPTEAVDGSHGPEFFAGREGYDPAFLGKKLPAPWPVLDAATEATLAEPTDQLPDRPFELRYTHFGVKYRADRKQPLMTAVNIDGEHTVRIKRTQDKWFADKRIAADIQLTQADYSDPQIDRGHMVRREDPNWDVAAAGSNDATQLAKDANADTFHYVNAALQHSQLNQGKQLWQGLENYILDSARTKGFKTCVFTGPVFRADDPELVEGLPVPREFWKLVVMPASGGKKLHATAYLLSQGDMIRDLLEKRSRVEAVEGFVLGPYRTFQIAIADLADATGYDLSAYIPADPLGQARIGDEAVDSREPVFVPLDSFEQIVA